MSKDKQPRISIILPTYNRVERLTKTLPSFLSTKLEDIEFIVLDNHSTDGTWEYLKKISTDDDRVRILKNPQNIGSVKSIFRLYCEARAPFVLFLADDDIMVGDYIRKCLEIFEKNHDVGVVHHYFESWESQNIDKEYSIVNAGHDAIETGFMMFGTYPGIAWRMSDLDLGVFPMDKGIIYPQVKVSLEIISKNKLAIIHCCGLRAVDFGDSVLDVKKYQNRPTDFGIGERLSYATNYKDLYLMQELVWAMHRWAYGVYEDLLLHSKKEARMFMVSLVPSIHRISPILIMMLARRRRIRDLLICSLLIVKHPVFVKNYLIFLWFCKKKIEKKYFSCSGYYS